MNPVSVALARRVLAVSDGSRHPAVERSMSELKAGETSVIVRIVPDNDPAAARRLFDLGFVPGASVECVRRAPLGDPTVFRVADFEIALRRAQSDAVHIPA